VNSAPPHIAHRGTSPAPRPGVVLAGCHLIAERPVPSQARHQVRWRGEYRRAASPDSGPCAQGLTSAVRPGHRAPRAAAALHRPFPVLPPAGASFPSAGNPQLEQAPSSNARRKNRPACLQVQWAPPRGRSGPGAVEMPAADVFACSQARSKLSRAAGPAAAALEA